MKYTIIVAMLFCAASSAFGQSTVAPKENMELSVTYDAVRANSTTGGSLWLQGGSAELSAGLYRGFGAVADVTGLTTSSGASAVPLTLVSTTFGARYTVTTSEHGMGRLAVFGQGLVGEAHALHSVLPNAQGATTDGLSFAAQAGGGIDLRLKSHLAVRVVQADWIRTQFPNGTTDVQNNLRLGAGVVFRLR